MSAISSKITKKPSFFHDIGLKGALKVFFILLIITIIFFIFWYIIKPEKISNSVGLVAMPQGGPLIPVDNSLCGTDIISCGNTDDCLAKCGLTGANNNYSCTTISPDQEVYYLGTKLPGGNSYCLPTSDSGNGNDPVISSCGTYTGRAVRSLNPDGKLGWVCQCKYPSFYSGDQCTTQVACQVEIVDPTDGSIKIQTGQLIRYNEDGTPYITPGATGSAGYVIFDPKAPDQTPVDTLQDGSPKWRCNCTNTACDANGQCLKGAISLPNDYYSCYPDICYAGQSTQGDTYYDLTTNSCHCEPGVTYKSNIDGFCYPLPGDLKSACVGSTNGGCLCGLEMILKYTQQSGSPPIYLGYIFKYKGKYYLSQVFDSNGQINNDPTVKGTIMLVEIDPSQYNFNNWKNWFFTTYLFTSWESNQRINRWNFSTIMNTTSNSNVTFARNNQGVCNGDCNQGDTPATSYNGQILAPTSVKVQQIAPNVSENLQKTYIDITFNYNTNLGLYSGIDDYGGNLILTLTPVNIPLDQYGNSQIVDLTGSYLDFFVSMHQVIKLIDLSSNNQTIFMNNWTESLTQGLYTADKFVNLINENSLYSNGVIPFPCTSYYYNRGNAPRCDSNTFIGDKTVGNDMMNPVGTVCTSLYPMSDPCATKSGANSYQLNPFLVSGYSCVCDTNTYYMVTENGKDQCLPKKQDCACCDYNRDDSCLGGKCTNKVYVESVIGTKCCTTDDCDDTSLSRCTSGVDIGRCSGESGEDACDFNWQSATCPPIKQP